MKPFRRFFARRPRVPSKPPSLPKKKRSHLLPSAAMAAGLGVVFCGYRDDSQWTLAFGAVVLALGLLYNFAWPRFAVLLVAIAAAVFLPALLLVIGLLAGSAFIALAIAADEGVDLPDIFD